MIHRFFKHTFFLAVILALVAGLVWGVAPVAAAPSASMSCNGNDMVVTFSGFSSALILGSGPGLPTGWLPSASYTFSGPGAWTGVQVSGFDHNSNAINISLGSITCPTGGGGGGGGGGGSTGGSSNTTPPVPDSDGDGLDDNNDPCPHDPDPNAVPDKDGYCPKDERAGRNGSQDNVVTFNTHGTNTQSIWERDANGNYRKTAEWAREVVQAAVFLPPGTSWQWPGLDGRMFQITYKGDGRFEGTTPDGQEFWFQRPVARPYIFHIFLISPSPGVSEDDMMTDKVGERISELENSERTTENVIRDWRDKLKQAQRDLDEILRAGRELDNQDTEADALDSAIRLLQKMIGEREAQLTNIRNQIKATRAIYAFLERKPGESR